MKAFKLYPFILILYVLAFFSCQKKGSIKRYDSLSIGDITGNLSLLNHRKVMYPPKVASFSYSQCMQNCEIIQRINHKYFKNDTLYLEFSRVENCAGRFQIDVDIKNQELTLDVSIKPFIRKLKDGSEVETVTMLACECFYNFDLIIANIYKMPDKILFDHLSFNLEQ